MAHFAKIENKIVTQVIVVNNEALGNLEFPESEPVGQEFIASLGIEGTWKQTSYNANFRGKYAGIGDTWTGQNFKSSQPEEIVTPPSE
jgi:hypothetical protein